MSKAKLIKPDAQATGDEEPTATHQLIPDADDDLKKLERKLTAERDKFLSARKNSEDPRATINRILPVGK